MSRKRRITKYVTLSDKVASTYDTTAYEQKVLKTKFRTQGLADFFITHDRFLTYPRQLFKAKTTDAV